MQNHWFRNSRIYHLLIDRFYSENMSNAEKPVFAGGTLQGVISKLDYVKNLGFDTIWISPPYKGVSYHGYHITDFYTIDEHFGTIADIELLIKKAHEKNLKVLVDLVPNHCSVEHPFFIDARNSPDSHYREWFYFDKRNNYLSFLGFKELAKINLENRQTHNYFIDNAAFWASKGFDGFRIDHVIGVPHSFLKDLRKRCSAINPSFVLIGEAWTEGISRSFFNTLRLRNRAIHKTFGISQKRVQLQYRNILHSVIDFECRNILLNYVKGVIDRETMCRKLDKHLNYYDENFSPLLFLDNHDTNRIMFECRNDEKKVLELFEIIQNRNVPISVYSGTEQLLSHKESVQSGKPFADLAVRKPMDFDGKTIVNLWK